MGVSRTRSILIIQGETNLGSDESEQNQQGEAVPSFPNIQESQELWNNGPEGA